MYHPVSIIGQEAWYKASETIARYSTTAISSHAAMPPRKSQLAPPKRRGQNDENTPIATEDTTQMMDTRAPSPTGSAPWGSPSPPSPPPPPPSPVQSMAPHLYSTRSYKPDGIYQRLPDRLFSKAAFAGHVDAFKGVEPNFEDTGRISLSKNGAPLRIILFGEMATVADGTRMTARGDRYPYDAPVSSLTMQISKPTS